MMHNRCCNIRPNHYLTLGQYAQYIFERFRGKPTREFTLIELLGFCTGRFKNLTVILA
jgi:hypothetical protein